MNEIAKILEQKLNKVSMNRAFLTDATGEVEQSYSYSEFFCDVIKMMNAMERNKLGNIVTLLDNSYPFVCVYFACLFSNRTIIPIDVQKGEMERQQILLENKECSVISETPYKEERSSIYDVHELLSENEVRKVMRDEVLRYLQNVDWERDFLITYTSGTSGTSKGVVHSAGNLFCCANAYAEAYHLGEDTVYVHTMPMSYMAGILNTIILPFVSFGQLILTERFSVKSAFRFWNKAEKYRVNAFWLSPSMLSLLGKLGNDKTKAYIKEVRPQFFIATAPLPKNVKQFFEDKFEIPLYQNYGLSETLFISGADGENYQDASSVGKCLPQVKVKFEEDGEILLWVPWMFKRYTNEDTQTYFKEEYYCTGDIGERNEQGKLYITDRKKNLIIRGGINISPKAIESVLETECPSVESVVFGVTNATGDEIVCLSYVSVKAEKNTGLEKEIERTVAEKLGKNYKIDTFFPVNAIPRNINGKTDRQQLKRMYMEK